MNNQVKFIFDKQNSLDNCNKFFQYFNEKRSYMVPKYEQFFKFDLNSETFENINFNQDKSIKYYPIFLILEPLFDENISVFDFIEPEVKERMQQGSLNILFIVACEAFNYLVFEKEFWLRRYYQLLNQHQIPVEHVHWAISEKRSSTPFLNVYHFNYFLEVAKSHYQFQLPHGILDKKVEKTKHFVCLNLQPKLHRLLLVSELFNQNLLDLGIVSCTQPGHSIDYAVDFHSRQFYSYLEKSNIIEITNDFLEKLPLNLDDFINKGSWWSNYDLEDMEHHANFYRPCLFNIVSETHIKGYFVTEKTTKPIMFKMPFMVLSSPGYLNYLKSLGFQTFPELFDESYDLESKLEHRVKIIVNNAKKLCQLSLNDLSKLIANVQDKLDHNFNVLMKLNLFSALEQDLAKDKNLIQTPYNNSATYQLLTVNQRSTFRKIMLTPDKIEGLDNHFVYPKINFNDKSELLKNRQEAKVIK
jgi:hypothetical protein